MVPKVGFLQEKGYIFRRRSSNYVEDTKMSTEIDMQ